MQETQVTQPQSREERLVKIGLNYCNTAAESQQFVTARLNDDEIEDLLRIEGRPSELRSDEDNLRFELLDYKLRGLSSEEAVHLQKLEHSIGVEWRRIDSHQKDNRYEYAVKAGLCQAIEQVPGSDEFVTLLDKLAPTRETLSEYIGKVEARLSGCPSLDKDRIGRKILRTGIPFEDLKDYFSSIEKRVNHRLTRAIESDENRKSVIIRYRWAGLSEKQAEELFELEALTEELGSTKELRCHTLHIMMNDKVPEDQAIVRAERRCRDPKDIPIKVYLLKSRVLRSGEATDSSSEHMREEEDSQKPDQVIDATEADWNAYRDKQNNLYRAVCGPITSRAILAIGMQAASAGSTDLFSSEQINNLPSIRSIWDELCRAINEAFPADNGNYKDERSRPPPSIPISFRGPYIERMANELNSLYLNGQISDQVQSYILSLLPESEYTKLISEMQSALTQAGHGRW